SGEDGGTGGTRGGAALRTKTQTAAWDEEEAMPILVRHSCNRRVTCDFSPSNARSESFLAVNPLNPYHMVGASKRFTDPATYQFSLATYVTFDGGLSWNQSMPLQLLPDWTGTTDPTLAWDDLGNVYLFALAFRPPMPGEICEFPDTCLLGIAVYKSQNGGMTWSWPNFIHPVKGDDKQWAAGDGNQASPFYGRVYAVWDLGNGGLAFTRTLDHGTSWTGWGANPGGVSVATRRPLRRSLGRRRRHAVRGRPRIRGR